MAWIESHQTLRDHPKTLELCRRLGAERPQVVGHLHLLWWWCVDYAPTGDLSKFNAEQLARAAEWVGEPARFLESMIDSGFIEQIGKTKRIHDWYHYCGALMERRLKRMEAKRPPMEAKRTPTVPDLTVPNQKKESIGKRVFVPPTPQEVEEYAKSEGFQIDGARFCAYYGSSNWMRNKTKITNWKLCTQTWKRTDGNGNNLPPEAIH